jgi:CHAT domain-containing protein
VVATRWRIGDRSTVPFVESLYNALAGGLPLSEALRAAKLDAISRGAPPREWAAFTAVGDSLVTVSLQVPSPFVRWEPLATVAFAALALALAAARYGARSRRRAIPLATDNRRLSPRRSLK